MQSEEYSLLDMKYAYIAGFFDGEGYIGARKRGKFYSLDIEVCNKDRGPIEFIVDVLGGSIHERPPSRGRCLHYRWMKSGLPAGKVLERLLPYLVCKKERAILGMELIYATDERKRGIINEIRTLNMIHGKGKGVLL